MLQQQSHAGVERPGSDSISRPEGYGRMAALQSVCKRATCSDLLEKMATDEQRSQGLDIADFLLMEDTPQMILQKMIERNPALQTLIDTFDLELMDAMQE